MLIYAQIMLFYAYFYAFMLKLCFYAFMLGVCHYAFFYASIIGTSQTTTIRAAHRHHQRRDYGGAATGA
jgi:hypothetical protein